jgi:DNA-binding response OmpR family regulator
MESPVVLVVEDEADLADLYANWLAKKYDVRTAYNGDEAIEQLDETIDVVLLDRRMPGKSGDAVLDVIADRALDCRVAMVTAVEPDFDIIDMGFDDYLVKPVDADDLLELVDRFIRRSQYDADAREFFSLASKKAVLETEKTEEELLKSEEYQLLTDELESLRNRMNELLNGLTDDDYEAVFREFGFEDSTE